MTFATLALAALLPTQASAAPAKVVPIAVDVRTDAKADAAVQAWAKELRTALGARKEEFRIVAPGQTPEFVVRLDSIGKRPDGTPVLNGSFVLGKGTPRPFDYGYTDVKAEAEKLARNLRKYADQMRAAPAGR
jgi:hypothetical protein